MISSRQLSSAKPRKCQVGLRDVVFVACARERIPNVKIERRRVLGFAMLIASAIGCFYKCLEMGEVGSEVNWLADNDSLEPFEDKRRLISGSSGEINIFVLGDRIAGGGPLLPAVFPENVQLGR